MDPHERKPSLLYSLRRNPVVLARFPHKYIGYLMPALIRVCAAGSCDGRDQEVMEKMVRIVVDMALAVSADGFAWSAALKRELERGTGGKELSDVNRTVLISSDDMPSSCREINGFNVVLMVNELRISSPLIRPPVPSGSRAGGKPMKAVSRRAIRPRRSVAVRPRSDEEEDLRHSMKTLRRILPGGRRMGVCELISEVGSYVTCLEMQVGILRSLLGPR